MYLDPEGERIYRRTIESLDEHKRRTLECRYWDNKVTARKIGVDPWIVKTYHEREQMKRDLAVGGLCLASMLIAAVTCWYVGFPPGAPRDLEERVVAPITTRTH